MKYAIFAIIGVVLLYELAAQTSEWFERHQDTDEEARLNRVRILNQQGMLPGQIDY